MPFGNVDEMGADVDGVVGTTAIVVVEAGWIVEGVAAAPEVGREEWAVFAALPQLVRSSTATSTNPAQPLVGPGLFIPFVQSPRKTVVSLNCLRPSEFRRLTR